MTVNYEGSGDVFFAFYNGDEQLTEMPKKDSGLGFERAECSNGASVEWDSISWAPKVLNITKTKTKCTLYFSANANNYSNIEDIMKNNRTMVEYDETEDWNLRYVGANPKNYIDIGDRDSDGQPILWRIIGLMNNMTVINDDGSVLSGQSLVKIIRADSIGSWSWDTSANEVNYGYGVNEWSQADIMTTLNKEAYWKKTSGQCYNARNDVKTTCDFSSIGLTASVKEKIAKVRWNTGTYDTYSYTGWFPKNLYKAERSNHNGKEQCASRGGSYCNDPVERSITWDGYIGLMYPSDYGYAVGGNARSECLAKTMHDWSGANPNCQGNDWLGTHQWTLTPSPSSANASRVFYLIYNGNVDYYEASDVLAVRPVAYLKSSIKIKESSTSNYGYSSNPYVIE